jgi:hypothetical protein
MIGIFQTSSIAFPFLIISSIYCFCAGMPGKNGQNDHLRPEQKDHPLAGAN